MWSHRKRYLIHKESGLEWWLVFDGAWWVEEVIASTREVETLPLAEFEETGVGRALALFTKAAIERAAQDVG